MSRSHGWGANFALEDMATALVIVVAAHGGVPCGRQAAARGGSCTYDGNLIRDEPGGAGYDEEQPLVIDCGGRWGGDHTPQH